MQDRETATLKGALTELTILAAHEADISLRAPSAVRPQPRVQPSRARGLNPLVDAAAAASAIEVAQRAQQHMVRIIGERRLDYQVEWSLPEGSPEVTWQRKAQLDRRAEYYPLVRVWQERRLEEEQKDELTSMPSASP